MVVIREYRGVRNLVYAEVIEDSDTAYETGTVKPLAGIAEISKTVETSNEAHYYDNIPAIVINSTGADEITCNVSAIPLDALGDITGQDYDAATGALIESSERATKYFALGYETKATDGTIMYVWRYKGSFSIPDMTAATEDDGTDANGQELTFTGISTIHRFEKNNKGAKGIIVDTSAGTADVSGFFDTVTTPDTLTAAGA